MQGRLHQSRPAIVGLSVGNGSIHLVVGPGIPIWLDCREHAPYPVAIYAGRHRMRYASAEPPQNPGVSRLTDLRAPAAGHHNGHRHRHAQLKDGDALNR